MAFSSADGEMTASEKIPTPAELFSRRCLPLKAKWIAKTYSAHSRYERFAYAQNYRLENSVQTAQPSLPVIESRLFVAALMGTPFAPTAGLPNLFLPLMGTIRLCRVIGIDGLDHHISSTGVAVPNLAGLMLTTADKEICLEFDVF